MGTQDGNGVQAVTEALGQNRPPNPEEIEVTLLGPGYGESAVLHIGNGAWVIRASPKQRGCREATSDWKEDTTGTHSAVRLRP